METIIQFLAYPQFTGPFFFLRIVFIALTAILFVLLIYFFNKASWWHRLVAEDMAEFFTYKPYGVGNIENMWKKISVRLETGRESEYKLAIIEAESILDDTLKKMGYAGETIGERLDKINIITLPGLNDVRDVHKIRNNIVHDPDYRLSLDNAKKTLEIYEKALRDLDVF